MPKLAFVDAFIYVNGFDFTGLSNTAQLTPDVETLDATTFGGDGWKEVAAGLRTSQFEAGGFFEELNKAVDKELFDTLGKSGHLAFFGAAETATQPAYMWAGTKSNYVLGGAVGELAPWSMVLAGADRYGVIRGQLAKPKGSQAATGVLGSVLSLGAVASGKRVYLGVQVFTAGTSITLKLQSDDTSGFASPTDRGTLGPITTAGTYFLPVDGPITDTHWRVNATAITGTFEVAALVGIA